MTYTQKLSVLSFAAVAALLTVAMQAQVGDPATLIKEKLVSQIKLTKTAADRSDIVTAGDAVELHKDGLVMCGSSSAYPGITTYKDGSLKVDWKTSLLSAGSNPTCSVRKFVTGEKFWVTGVTVQKDAIAVAIFSDVYNDVRYYGEIKFPLPKKGPVPPVDDFVKTVSEVITVAPTDNSQTATNNTNTSSNSNNSPQPAAPVAPPPAQMAAIPPPPPPTDAPAPTIAIGQTKEQVTAGFGQPVRTAKLAGTKEIYFYKDMKVTFVAGKVTNVE